MVKLGILTASLQACQEDQIRWAPLSIFPCVEGPLGALMSFSICFPQEWGDQKILA